MSDNEKRRVELLEQMRNNSIPVIHPRYRATYNSVYNSEKNYPKKNRVWGILLFVFFLGMGYYTYVEQPVIDTGYVIERIEQEVSRLVDFAISD